MFGAAKSEDDRQAADFTPYNLPALGCLILLYSLRRMMGNLSDIAQSLESFASLSVTEGTSSIDERSEIVCKDDLSRIERAGKLWGAAEALRDSIGAPTPLDVQKKQKPLIAQARSAMGEAAFDNARAAGFRMTRDQAVAYALEEHGGQLVVYT